MNDPVRYYWQIRLQEIKERLNSNNFVAYVVDTAAPANAMRLDAKTPCVKASHCADCSSPGRICNTWMITEKSFPKGRIKVVLINEDLGI